jgi:hypothetical protein
MPMLIEHIDAIARKKGRDVLFLDFPQKKIDDEIDLFVDADWDNLPVRLQVIAWLDKNKIEWSECGHFANENIMCGYRGRIYIDVPFDTENSVFQKLSSYFETQDGVMKIGGVVFCYLPLDVAMQNAHHDEPGFWDRWAENF